MVRIILRHSLNKINVFVHSTDASNYVYLSNIGFVTNVGDEKGFLERRKKMYWNSFIFLTSIWYMTPIFLLFNLWLKYKPFFDLFLTNYKTIEINHLLPSVTNYTFETLIPFYNILIYWCLLYSWIYIFLISDNVWIWLFGIENLSDRQVMKESFMWAKTESGFFLRKSSQLKSNTSIDVFIM